MPSLSTKGQEMPESPIRKLVPYASSALEKGRTVYHLNIGQPDIKTPQVVLDEIHRMNVDIISYTKSEGLDSYKQKLAGYYQSKGIDITGNELMVTTGGSEALLFTIMTCLNPGDEIIIPEPFYANYNGFSIAAGVRVVPVSSDIRSGFALPPIDEFEKLITERTKAILICNPGNPTGYIYSKEELETLRDIVKRHDLFLIADEVYREFAYDGTVHHSVMKLEGLENHAIVVDSVSKRYSMCGARIGAIVSRNQEIMQTVLKFAQARLSPPLLAQIASEAALQTPQSYFDEVIEEYVDRRNFLVAALNEIKGVFCPMPKGAFYCMAELPVEDADHFAQWMLETFEYKNQTVMLAPAAGFYSSPGMGKNQVRIAYVLNKESLKNAVETLAQGLKAYVGKAATI